MKKSALASLLGIMIWSFLTPLVYADDFHSHGIKLDGSLGNAGNLDLPGPNYEIKAEYGHQSGANLFHSFQTFNLHSGETAMFNGPSSVKNIISRVTGEEISWIDGKLGSSISGADMYFLNPAGLIFGPHAALDLTGSFHASTADYLRLGENDRFYAQALKSEVLSIAAPSAFGFLDDDISSITLEGRGTITEQEWNEHHTGLAVSKGQTISLIAGDIEIKKGIISAPEGQIIIGSIDSPGEMKMKNWTFEPQFPNCDSQLSNSTIKIRDQGVLDVSGGGSGSIFIQSGRFIMDNSKIDAKTLGDKNGGLVDIQADTVSLSDGAVINGDTYGFGKGTDIQIRASDSIILSGENEAALSTAIYTQSHGKTLNSGNAGSVSIYGKNISLIDGANIFTTTYGKGRGGDVHLHAQDSIMFYGIGSDRYGSSIELAAHDNEKGAGDSGDLYISAKNISFKDYTVIRSSTQGRGYAGDITLTAEESIHIRESFFYMEVGKEAAGSGGDFQIQGKNISITSASFMSSNTHGQGNAGNISMKASEDIKLSQSSIHLAATLFGEGDGGSLLMDAENIFLKDGATINSSTYGNGTSGNITLTASESFHASDSSILAVTAPYKWADAGDAGTISIETQRLSLTDGAEIKASSLGTGKGGDILLNAKESLSLSGTNAKGFASKVYTSSLNEQAAAGDAGNVLIQTHQLLLKDGSVIIADTAGPGKGGQITIEASGTVELSGVNPYGKNEDGFGSGIYARSKGEKENSGDAGDIDIQADTVNLNHGSEISTSTQGIGKAGDIHVSAGKIHLDQGASISSASESEFLGGDAGRLYLHAEDEIRIINNSFLSTGAKDAGGGAMTINAQNLIDMNHAEITTSVQGGDGKGGDINIADPQVIILNQSEIKANAYQGDGGNIHIIANQFIPSSKSKVSASSRLGIDGTINIESPEDDISSGLTILPSNLLDITQWIKTPCSQRYNEKESRFYILGRDANPSPLDDLQDSPILDLNKDH